MRPEKAFLVEEVTEHLDKSDFLFLTNFDRLNVTETADLRGLLAKHDAEFHVVKNSILNVAVKQRELPDLNELLDGPTAIVVGGQDAPGVAKTLLKFFKDKSKVEIKGGLLGQSIFAAGDAKAISEMPPLEQVRAEFLGLLQAPAQQLLFIFQAPAQDMVNVLNAPARDLLGVFVAKEAKEAQSAA